MKKQQVIVLPFVVGMVDGFVVRPYKTMAAAGTARVRTWPVLAAQKKNTGTKKSKRSPAASPAANPAASSPPSPPKNPNVQIFDLENSDETPAYAKPRQFDENLLQVDNRPGGTLPFIMDSTPIIVCASGKSKFYVFWIDSAIIESEEQLRIKDEIMQDMDSGKRKYPGWFYTDYGELAELEEAEYDNDDPEAIDSSTLGTWTIFDLESQFDYEWHPNKSRDPDPNKAALAEPDTRYLKQNPVDEDGIEIGFTAVFGPSNPIDERTILGTKDSYMIDERYRDDSLLTPIFPEGDPEIEYNENVVRFRQSLELLETYIDPFLPQDMPIPRHVAKWHGYPEQVWFEPKNYTNNRFTADEDRTDFNALSPFRARQKAVELARSKNAEWLPDGVSQAWHQKQREPYESYQTLMGTLRKGDIDESVREQIQPVLKVLGSCVDLLSTHETDEGTIFRFEYHGLMKNKYGMKCWTESMIQDCGVKVSNVVFETGFRRRDPAYDGGDAYYGPRHY